MAKTTRYVIVNGGCSSAIKLAAVTMPALSCLDDVIQDR